MNQNSRDNEFCRNNLDNVTYHCTAQRSSGRVCQCEANDVGSSSRTANVKVRLLLHSEFELTMSIKHATMIKRCFRRTIFENLLMYKALY